MCRSSDFGRHSQLHGTRAAAGYFSRIVGSNLDSATISLDAKLSGMTNSLLLDSASVFVVKPSIKTQKRKTDRLYPQKAHSGTSIELTKFTKREASLIASIDRPEEFKYIRRNWLVGGTRLRNGDYFDSSSVTFSNLFGDEKP